MLNNMKKLIRLFNPFILIYIPVHLLAYLCSLKYKKIIDCTCKFSRSLLQRNLVTIYSFFVGLNLIFVTYYIVNLLNIRNPDYSYFIGVVLYFNPHKRVELIAYVLGLILLGIWFAASVFCEKFLSFRARKYAVLSLQALTKKNYYVLMLAIVANVILPIIVFNLGNYNFITLVIELICLFTVIAIPFWSYLLKFGPFGIFSFNQSSQPLRALIHEGHESRRSKLISLALIISGIVYLGYIFYTPIVKHPQIINEYYNIPEQTILENNQVVDNTRYWRSHFISPVTVKGDVVTELSKQNCLNTTLTNINVLTPHLDNYSMYYDEILKLFCVNGNLPLDSFSTIATVKLNQTIAQGNVVVKFDGNVNIFSKKLYNILEHNNKLNMQQQLYVPTNQDKLFMAANQYEIGKQVGSRFMIHHNSFMFIPVSSILLHESSSQVSAQYGLGNAKLFAYFFKKRGDISFDNWLRVSYSFYVIYFIILIFIIALITRSYACTAIILVMSLLVENLHGYDFLLLGPGESPWREFFDLFVVLFLFIYSRNQQFIFYLVALVLGAFSVLVNPQIGLMISVAVILSGLFYSLYEQVKINATIICSALAFFVSVGFFICGSGVDSLSTYYFDGVLGFAISDSQLFKIFVVICIGYLILKNIIQRSRTGSYLHLVFLVIYAQELLFYVIWHFDIAGFLARGHIYVITILLLAFQFKEYFSVNLNKMLGLFALGLYGYSVIFMLQSKYQYEQIFEQHVIYNWNLDRAHITSTMNPAYFENGVKLIKKYSNNQNGIYIISEYDNFLPFLAHKYNLMPFFDMKWYVVTPKELDNAIKLLQHQQPTYLFVDTNVGRNLNNEIIDSNLLEIGNNNQDSIWRVQRLKLLNLVYQSIAANYTLVESGSLISVYKRR